jgi:hypothetical protein
MFAEVSVAARPPAFTQKRSTTASRIARASRRVPAFVEISEARRCESMHMAELYLAKAYRQALANHARARVERRSVPIEVLPGFHPGNRPQP